MGWDADDFIGLIFIVGMLVLMGLVIYFDYQKKTDTKKLEADQIVTANQLVNSEADELSKLKRDNGSFIQVDKDRKVDPWKNPIKVTYSHNEDVEELQVRSAGPDGKFETSDDIFTQRFNVVRD